MITLGHSRRDVDVAIVGGGVAGLATAFHLLSRAPHRRVLVLERAARVGGNVKTLRRDGCTIDLGPDALIARPASAIELCESLGTKLVGPGPASRRVQVAHRRRLAPLPEGLVFGVPRNLASMASTKLLSFGGKLRAACDLVLPSRATEGLGLGAIVERRLGREAKEALVEPLLSGVYGGDVDRLDAAVVMPQLASAKGSLIRALATTPKPQGSPFRAPTSGMEGMVDALHAALGEERVHTGVSVRSIERDGDGFRLVVEENGTRRTITAERVVVASPPPAAASVLRDLDSELAEALDAFTMRSSTSVVMAFERAACTLPEGSGVLVARNEPCCFVAATFVHAKWPERVPDDLAVIRAVVTADRAPDLVNAEDATLTGRVLADLRRFATVPDPRWSVVERFDRATPIPEVGHRDRVARARARAAAIGIDLAGAAFDGPGLAGCVRGAETLAAALAP